MSESSPDGDPVLTQEPKVEAAQSKKPPSTMINFWLDAALFFALIFLIWVSAMTMVVFPVPTEAEGWMLWGLDFNQWRNVQFISLCICSALALEHLVLHWNWVCGVIATKILRVKGRPDQGIQAVYGVGTFISILLAMLAGIVAAMVFVRKPPM